jgi:hypothetical protein
LPHISLLLPLCGIPTSIFFIKVEGDLLRGEGRGGGVTTVEKYFKFFLVEPLSLTLSPRCGERETFELRDSLKREGVLQSQPSGWDEGQQF